MLLDSCALNVGPHRVPTGVAAPEDIKCSLDWRPSLLGARTLLRAPGIATRNKKLRLEAIPVRLENTPSKLCHTYELHKQKYLAPIRFCASG